MHLDDHVIRFGRVSLFSVFKWVIKIQLYFLSLRHLLGTNYKELDYSLTHILPNLMSLAPSAYRSLTTHVSNGGIV